MKTMHYLSIGFIYIYLGFGVWYGWWSHGVLESALLAGLGGAGVATSLTYGANKLNSNFSPPPSPPTEPNEQE